MENPYAPPAADVTTPPLVPADAETLRKDHLKHETSIKGIGLLFVVGGFVAALATVASLAGLLSKGTGLEGGAVVVVSLLIFIVGLTQFTVGLFLRRLAPWTRIPTMILSAVSMINIPVGTLIGGYFLYLVASKKGKTILSPEYADVVAATPHIKYKTPAWLWILLGLLVIFLLVIIAFAATNKQSPL